MRPLKILLAIFSTSFFTVSLAINQAELDEIALVHGYGYKFANLVMVERLVRSAKYSYGYKLAVPPFDGVSSPSLQEFLKQHGKVDIVARWKQITNAYAFDKEASIKNNKFSAGYLQDSARLEEDIKKGFQKIAKNIATNPHSDTAHAAKKLLASVDYKLMQNGEKLMVRSSGREDTKTLPNAGGNISVANVGPTIVKIVEAMGDVVSSYFGEKSLKQRLGAQDEALFDAHQTLTPVLIQEMIGEKSEKEIPKCGVMFTEEAEGATSRLSNVANSQNGRATSGIALIQSAYGHNEAVVNSLIPVDSYYVDEQKNIYPVIRYKHFRLLPSLVEDKKLVMQENPPLVAKRGSLSREAVLTLKSFAEDLEGLYDGDPMDVEFVVNEQEKTIYIVQARPIVHKKDMLPASYIRDPDSIQSDMKIEGEAIGVAGGSLRFCNSAHQIIVASTINEALSDYQDEEKTPNPREIECVVVGKMAPATSHEATTFRGEGKAVLFFKDWQRIQNWTKVDGFKIVLSPQQGLAINYVGNANNLDELLQVDPSVSLGWANYPMTNLISVDRNYLPHETGSKLRTIRKTFREIEYGLEKWRETSLQKLLNIAATSADESDTKAALKDIVTIVNVAVNKSISDSQVPHARKEKGYTLLAYVYFAANAVLQNFRHNVGEQKYINRLLPIRILQSLLTQQDTSQEIVAASSLERLYGSLLVREKLTAEFPRLDDMAISQMALRSLATTDLVRDRWQKFVVEVHRTATIDKRNALTLLLSKIHNLTMVPLWINSSFNDAYANGSSSANVLIDMLVDEYASQEEFLDKLQAIDRKIKNINVNAFADPKKFTTQWKIFSDEALEFFLRDLNAYYDLASTNNFAKQSANSITQYFVNNVFDLGIKALTGSQMYKNTVEEKVVRFAIMLRAYFTLLEKLVPKEILKLHFVESILRDAMDNPSERHLKQTPGVSIEAWTIGSGNIGVIKPQTLEDIFQIIHQSLLFALGQRSIKAGLSKIDKPLPLAKLEQLFSGYNRNSRREPPYLVSGNFQGDTVSFTYNQPLREHSVQIVVEYNRHTEKINFTLKYFGVDELGRWQAIEKFAHALSQQVERLFPGILRVNNISRTKYWITVELEADQNGVVLLNLFLDKSNSITFYMVIPPELIVSIPVFSDDYIDKLLVSSGAKPLIEAARVKRLSALIKNSSAYRALDQHDKIIRSKATNEQFYDAAAKAAIGQLEDESSHRELDGKALRILTHVVKSGQTIPLKTAVARAIDVLGGYDEDKIATWTKSEFSYDALMRSTTEFLRSVIEKNVSVIIELIPVITPTKHNELLLNEIMAFGSYLINDEDQKKRFFDEFAVMLRDISTSVDSAVLSAATNTADNFLIYYYAIDNEKLKTYLPWFATLALKAGMPELQQKFQERLEEITK